MRRALLLTGLVVALSAAGAAESAAAPRCFGAAARDAEHPCHNPKLRFSVVPTPSDAPIIPSAPCSLISARTGPQVCAFGLPATRTRVSFALVGDSHAVHWRAALEVVARAKGWRGVSLDQSQCLFSTTVTALREPLRADCIRWNAEVRSWLGVHSEVHTMFTSQHRGGSVVVAPGQTPQEAKIEGYIAAWKALPASVEHIYVIRDVPYDTNQTPSCVRRAMARHTRAPGTACARSRRAALGPDPIVLAARRLHSRRVRVIDLSRYMCGRRKCFPVVGGVLVHKDIGHLTRQFSTSLGRFVLRALGRLS